MSRLTRWKSPPGTGPELLGFQYGRLRSVNSIRLVRINPGSGNRAISIDLVDSFVSGPGQAAFEEYDALSYTWGVGPQDKSIFCNGRRLYVTHTLLEALKHFRSATEIVTLWIDQLCICQDRVIERNQQVQMMGKIFKGARKVSVWLGAHWDDSRAGMQLAQQLLSIRRDRNVVHLDPEQFENYGLPSLRHKRWRALAAILRRPWFSRTWIVQEVTLNPNVVLILGDQSLGWDDLEAIVDLLEGPSSLQWQTDLTMSSLELPFSRINRIRKRHQMASLHTPRILDDTDLVAEPDQANGEDLDLLDLLLMSRDLGATDPRDKVYALLGLTNHDMTPDYSSSPEHIFNEFAMHIVGEVTKLAAQSDGKISSSTKEVQKALIKLSCAGKPNQERDLPSWVPDWTTTLRCRPLVYGKYCAGGRMLEMDWTPETGLQLFGRLIDTVVAAGSVRLEYDAAMIAPWWQEAKHIARTAGMQTVRSPGSTAHMDVFDAMRRDLSIDESGRYQDTALDDARPQHQRRRSSLLDETELTQENAHNPQQTLTTGPTRGRVVFSTTGYIGLAPHGTTEGDLVYIVLGASVPYILRAEPDGTFILIGECYVQGIMQGEILAMDHESGFEEICIK